jgi:hypothetical protein
LTIHHYAKLIQPQKTRIGNISNQKEKEKKQKRGK